MGEGEGESPSHVAAVEVEPEASDEGGVIAGEIGHAGGDVLGTAKCAHGRLGGHVSQIRETAWLADWCSGAGSVCD